MPTLVHINLCLANIRTMRNQKWLFPLLCSMHVREPNVLGSRRFVNMSDAKRCTCRGNRCMLVQSFNFRFIIYVIYSACNVNIAVYNKLSVELEWNSVYLRNSKKYRLFPVYHSAPVRSLSGACWYTFFHRTTQPSDICFGVSVVLELMNINCTISITCGQYFVIYSMVTISIIILNVTQARLVMS